MCKPLGMGFTMSLFITLLALGEHTGGEAVAKLAILLASGLAGTAGYFLLRSTPQVPMHPVPAG